MLIRIVSVPICQMFRIWLHVNRMDHIGLHWIGMDQIRLHWIDGQVVSISGVAVVVVVVGLMTHEGDFPFCAL